MSINKYFNGTAITIGHGFYDEKIISNGAKLWHNINFGNKLNLPRMVVEHALGISGILWQCTALSERIIEINDFVYYINKI